MTTNKFERTGQNVVTIRHIIHGEMCHKYLLVSDVHLDNPHCERPLLLKHLAEAVSFDAGILFIGDLIDGMAGRNDPRRSKTGTMSEHNQDNYLDLLVDSTTEFLRPYADNIVMLADGNHETSIRRNVETDLLDRVAKNLNVHHLGYSGWIRFLFGNQSNGHNSSRKLFYHHGAGGGGEVTRGVIGTNRRAVYLPDADIVCTGHIHESWQVEIVRHRLTDAGRERRDSQWHVQLPTYKNEFDLRGGYHIEKGRPPKPLGGWWLEFRYSRNDHGRVNFVLTRAN